MFLDFYKMREQPFGGTPDPRFLYLGKSHREALASLFYGMEADCGFTALIADPGLGKTTLTLQLLDKLQGRARTVFLFQSQCNSRELFQYLLNALGVDAAGMEMVSMHNKLNEILLREMLAGRRIVLAIDEAQNLDFDVLETIRLLSNFETSSEKLLHIVLIGQPQLAHKLTSPTLLQLQQRISMFARLQPLDADEMVRYIAHRLEVAGYEGSSLFTSGALQILHNQSQGIPRNINRLCFGALSLGYAMGRTRIDSEIMREVVADLDVESFKEKLPKSLPTNVRISPSPVTFASPGLTSNSRVRQWAFCVSSVIVLIVFASVFLPSSVGKIGNFLFAKAEAFHSVPLSAASTERAAPAASPSVPVRFTALSEDIPLIPHDFVLAPSAPPTSDVETVVVQPGDTLRQIAVRSLGLYNDEIGEEIRDLNPLMIDLNHIEVGQEVKMPRVSAPSGPSAIGRAANTIGKN